MVNMTTVPEVVLAKEAGLSYAAIGQLSWQSCLLKSLKLSLKCLKLSPLISTPPSAALVTDYDCWRQSHGAVDQQSVMKVRWSGGVT